MARAKEYYDRAMVYFSKGQYDQAIADFSEAIRLNPRDAYAYCNRGIAYGQTGFKYDSEKYDSRYAFRNSQRFRDFSEAIRLDPDCARAYKERAKLHGGGSFSSNWGGPEGLARTIADYSEAIRIDPDDERSYHNRALVYQDQFNHEDPVLHDKAIADFSEAIRINPSDYALYGSRGHSYLLRGKQLLQSKRKKEARERLVQARSDFTQSLALDSMLAPIGGCDTGLQEANSLLKTLAQEQKVVTASGFQRVSSKPAISSSSYTYPIFTSFPPSTTEVRGVGGGDKERSYGLLPPAHPSGVEEKSRKATPPHRPQNHRPPKVTSSHQPQDPFSPQEREAVRQLGRVDPQTLGQLSAVKPKTLERLRIEGESAGQVAEECKKIEAAPALLAYYNYFQKGLNSAIAGCLVVNSGIVGDDRSSLAEDAFAMAQRVVQIPFISGPVLEAANHLVKTYCDRGRKKEIQHMAKHFSNPVLAGQLSEALARHLVLEQEMEVRRAYAPRVASGRMEELKTLGKKVYQWITVSDVRNGAEQLAATQAEKIIEHLMESEPSQALRVDDIPNLVGHVLPGQGHVSSSSVSSSILLSSSVSMASSSSQGMVAVARFVSVSTADIHRVEQQVAVAERKAEQKAKDVEKQLSGYVKKEEVEELKEKIHQLEAMKEKEDNDACQIHLSGQIPMDRRLTTEGEQFAKEVEERKATAQAEQKAKEGAHAKKEEVEELRAQLLKLEGERKKEQEERERDRRSFQERLEAQEQKMQRAQRDMEDARRTATEVKRQADVAFGEFDQDAGGGQRQLRRELFEEKDPTVAGGLNWLARTRETQSHHRDVLQRQGEQLGDLTRTVEQLQEQGNPASGNRTHQDREIARERQRQQAAAKKNCCGCTVS